MSHPDDLGEPEPQAPRFNPQNRLEDKEGKATSTSSGREVITDPKQLEKETPMEEDDEAEEGFIIEDFNRNSQNSRLKRPTFKKKKSEGPNITQKESLKIGDEDDPDRHTFSKPYERRRSKSIYQKVNNQEEGVITEEVSETVTNIQDLLQKLCKGKIQEDSKNMLLFQSQECPQGIKISWADFLKSSKELWKGNEAELENFPTEDPELKNQTSVAKPLNAFDFGQLEDMGDMLDGNFDEFDDEWSDVAPVTYGTSF